MEKLYVVTLEAEGTEFITRVSIETTEATETYGKCDDDAAVEKAINHIKSLNFSNNDFTVKQLERLM